MKSKKKSSSQSSKQIEHLRKNLIKSTRHFIASLRQLNKKCLKDEKFLEHAANQVKHLADVSYAAKSIHNRRVEMLEEDLNDAGEIIFNVLNQPLAISDIAENDITFLSSAIQFNEKGVAFSGFNAVLREFLEYPESADTLLTELDFIVEDLEKYSR